MKKQLTPYQKHKKKWNKCHRCDLASRRNQVVLCRGKLPAEILFIGEAPGVSEDVLGKPFVGPAGKLLGRIIEVSVDGRFDYALTNLIACIPKDKSGKKISEPTDDCIKKCAERLDELVGICTADLVISVGLLAKEHTQDWSDVSIIHPAAILRMDESQKPLAVKRCVAIIERAILDTFKEDATPF